jgi:hypothetical protein
MPRALSALSPTCKSSYNNALGVIEQRRAIRTALREGNRRDGAPLLFGGSAMFLILAIVLVVAWLAGFVVFHTAGFLIHLLLIFAVISFIIHFITGRRTV